MENKRAGKVNKGSLIKLATNFTLLVFIAFGITYAIVKEVRARKAAEETVQLLKTRDAPATQAKQAGVYGGAAVKPIAEKSKVIAYYLHATGRCSNCIKIEKWSKEAMDKYFAAEQKDGRLEFRVLNVDEGENRHFINDYKLVTKSLVLSLVKGGKEEKFEVLGGVWDNLGNQAGFYKYVRGKTAQYIKETN